ncbi:hypothetical protein PPERSA_04907 [Pseudocohnilembus persalinus]|uniref:Uncharacterized protein n=1 Tax=Pseudocohnilembus persalinus TaxID=266149 RepID=A0A0V0QJ62_PSEPJ|nr:hypothetical protein PPERSA_04907 [Pseudocohnilembus persalinus]|eukprot:KRX02285.1 hypothetical protein PPERSA_04907 [Pseudocohnilembus persalinus]
MNFNQEYFCKQCQYPGYFFQPIEEIWQQIWINDGINKEIDDEKIQQLLDIYKKNQITDPKSITQLHLNDILLSIIYHKLEKKIEIIKKTINEYDNFSSSVNSPIINVKAGNLSQIPLETIKQLEKLDNQCLNYLKNVFFLLQQLQQASKHGPDNLYYNFSSQNSITELLYYSDNLEVNFYVFKIAMLYLNNYNGTKISVSNIVFGGSIRAFTALQEFNNYFLVKIREQFPFSVELFKWEKFFKDTGHIKPDNIENVNDSCKIKINQINLNITSVKKEIGEHYLSYNSTLVYLQQNRLDFKQTDKPFLKVMFALRVGVLGIQNKDSFYNKIWSIFENFLDQDVEVQEFEGINFQDLNEYFGKHSILQKEILQKKKIPKIIQNYQAGNKQLGPFLIFIIQFVDFQDLQQNLEEKQVIDLYLNAKIALEQGNYFQLFLQEYTKKFEQNNQKFLNHFESQIEQNTDLQTIKQFLGIDIFVFQLANFNYRESLDVNLRQKLCQPQKSQVVQNLTDLVNKYVKFYQQKRDTEKQLISHPNIENIYNQIYFQSLLSLNAQTSDQFIENILRVLKEYINHELIDLYEDQFLSIIKGILDIIHPCSSNRQVFYSNILTVMRTFVTNDSEKSEFLIILECLSQSLKQYQDDPQLKYFTFDLIDQKTIIQKAYIYEYQIEDIAKGYLKQIIKIKNQEENQDEEQYVQKKLQLYQNLIKNQQIGFLFQWLKSAIYKKSSASFSDDQLIPPLEKLTSFLSKYYKDVLIKRIDFQSELILGQLNDLIQNQDTLFKETCRFQSLYKKLSDIRLYQIKFFMSKFLLTKDLKFNNIKDSGIYILGLPQRLHKQFNNYRYQHLIQPMNKLLTGICLDLLPDSVDMTDLRSLFKSFFEFIVIEHELRKFLRQIKMQSPINIGLYFQKVASFLRSLHIACIKFHIEPTLRDYSLEDILNLTVEEQIPQNLKILKKQNKLTEEDSEKISEIQQKNHQNKGEENFLKIQHEITQINNNITKLELNNLVSLETRDKAQQGALQPIVNHQQAFAILFKHIIQVYKCGPKIKQKLENLPENPHPAFVNNLKMRLKMSEIAQNYGFKRCVAILDGMISLLMHEVITNGLHLDENEIKQLALLTYIMFQWHDESKFIENGNDINTEATNGKFILILAKNFSDQIQKLLKSHFEQQNNGQLICMSVLLSTIEQVHSKMMQQENVNLDQNVKRIVQKLNSEMEKYHDLNSANIIHFLIVYVNEVAIKLQWFATSFSKPKQSIFQIFQGIQQQEINLNDHTSLILTHWNYYVVLLDIFAIHFQKSPTNIPEYMSSSVKLLNKFTYWIKEKLMKELPQDDDSESYNVLLKSSLKWLETFLLFSDSTGFKQSQEIYKNLNVARTLYQVLNLILICMSKLSPLLKIKENNFQEILRLILKLLTLKQQDPNSQFFNKKIQQLNYNYSENYSSSYWSQVIRIIEILFTYSKENFVRSNLEIRIKNQIFDEQTKRFLYSISFEEISKYIYPDMLEYSRPLTEVLIGMFEGFEEDPETLKELMEQAKKLSEPIKDDEEENVNNSEEKKLQDENDQNSIIQGENQKQDEISEKMKEDPIESQKSIVEIDKKNFDKPKKIEKKIKLIHMDTFFLITSRVTKLSQNQKALIDGLIQNLVNNMKLALNEAKQKQMNTQKQNMQAQQNRYVLGFDFCNATICMLIKKFPLIIPHFIERKIEIDIEKDLLGIMLKDSQINFIDYLILINGFANNKFSNILETLCEVSYTFIFDQENSSKSAPIPTKHHFIKLIFERALLFTKKIADKKDFLNSDILLALYFSTISSLKLILNSYSDILTEKHVQQILAFSVNIFSKAKSMQEIMFFENLNLFQFINQSLNQLIKLNFKQKLFKNYNDETAEMLKFYLNTNFMKFFDKEKIQTLEKHYQLDIKEINKSIPTNSKQHQIVIPQNKSNLQISTMGFSMAQTLHGDMLKSTNQQFLLENFKYTFYEQHFLNFFYQDKIMMDMQKLQYNSEFKHKLDNQNYQFFSKNSSQHPESFTQVEIDNMISFKTKMLPIKTLERLLESLFFERKEDQDNWFQTQQAQLKSQNFQQKLQEREKNYLKKNKKLQMAEKEKLKILNNKFDFEAIGFKQSDLSLFNIEEEYFNSLSNQEKIELLQQKRELFKMKEKMQLVFLREVNLLENRLKKMNNNDEKEQTNQQEDQSKPVQSVTQELKNFLNSQQVKAILSNLPTEDQKSALILMLEKSLVDVLPKELKDYYQNQKKQIGSQNQLKSGNNDVQNLFRQLEIQFQQQIQNIPQGLFGMSEDLIQGMNQQAEQQGVNLFQNIYNLEQMMQSISPEQMHNLQNESEINQENEDEVDSETSEKEDDKNFDPDDFFFQGGRNQEDQILEQADLNIDSYQLMEQNEKQKNIPEKYQGNRFCQNYFSSLENILSFVPTFDEKFILNLVLRCHLTQNLQNLKEFLKVFLINPYNAYKFTDAIYFLIINNIIPKQGLENPLFDLDIVQLKNQNQFRPEPTKLEKKMIKGSWFLKQILKFIIQEKINIPQQLLFNYPLHHKDQYELVTGNNQLQKFEVQFKPLEIFKDFKISQVFGKQYGDSFSMFQINNQYLKFINQEHQYTTSIFLSQNKIKDLKSDLIKSLDQTMRVFLKQISFQGNQKALDPLNYPIPQKPKQELNMEFLVETILSRCYNKTVHFSEMIWPLSEGVLKI